MSETLWCVHIAGPDEEHAAPDFWTALAWAADLNAFMAKKAEAGKWAGDDNWALVQATVQPWDGTPERHAEDLARELARRAIHRQSYALADRDVRKEQVRDWVVRCWGEGAVGVVERVERFFEEAAELTQAEGISRDRLAEIIRHVYDKEPGKPPQEVGGIGTTLLAYCAAKGISADECERRELSRILGKPVDHFRARHDAKVRSGLAQPIEAEPSR